MNRPYGNRPYGNRPCGPMSIIVVAIVAGCGDCAGKPAPSAQVSSAAPAPTRKTALTGFVRLAPGAELPLFPPEVMERKVLSHVDPGTYPEACTPPKIADRQPVRLTSDGKLVGVMVAASEFARARPRPPVVHDLVIEDCRLTPRLIVAMKGDKLRVKNAVKFPFMPTLGAGYVETLTPGQVKEIPLDSGGVQPVLCGFTAPCGRADVIVLLHPLYATTGSDGSFRIEDFPPDETIKLNAWHPLFAATDISVRVPRGQEKSVELILSPLPPPAPPPAAPQTRAHSP